jgi:hypothetical protein
MSKRSFINLQRSLPSLLRRNVTREFLSLYTLDTIDHNRNVAISLLARSLCMNDSRTHLQIAFASSASNTYLATALNAFMASKLACPSMMSLTQLLHVFFESIAISAAKSNLDLTEMVNASLHSSLISLGSTYILAGKSSPTIL